MQVKLAPSILSADFARLGDQIREAEAAGADWIHVDVMDGHFVPNITMGPPVLRSIRHVTDLPLDVHLMIERPEQHLAAFVNAGADRITVHVETCPHLHRTVQQIRDLGAVPGVTLNPATPLSALEEILPYVDLVLIMSVNPGFGGQTFIPASLPRVARTREMLLHLGATEAEIEVDGGVQPSNVPQLIDAGATVLVAGSAVFNQLTSVRDNLDALRRASHTE